MKNIKNYNYIVIDNCPVCRGTLLYTGSVLSRKKVIHCLQCGREFRERRWIKKGNNSGAVMYVEPLYKHVYKHDKEDTLWKNY